MCAVRSMKLLFGALCNQSVLMCTESPGSACNFIPFVRKLQSSLRERGGGRMLQCSGRTGISIDLIAMSGGKGDLDALCWRVKMCPWLWSAPPTHRTQLISQIPRAVL
ncbi:hypothetical protein EJ04DRAFT_528601 [Polyplosphaeria fusca]|uniref:Secreted protein n=1 Tax=Polyplosphaeria fusca TaxID=682080 RepID=A0A9P4QL31_9PLEO|nr:hypothetical protein EJ04DRAFT_528601 [Polyplosphaeria fusca]